MIDLNSMTLIQNLHGVKIFALAIFRLIDVQSDDGVHVTAFQAESKIAFIAAESAAQAQLLYSEFLEPGERIGQVAEVPTAVEMAAAKERVV